MQHRRAYSPLERFILGAALAVPSTSRAHRRSLRSAAIGFAGVLNAFVAKHTALALALVFNTVLVLLLSLINFRSHQRLGPISFTLGNSSLLEENGNDEESGNESTADEENPAQGLRYTIPATTQPVAAAAAPKPAQLPAVIETLANSRFTFTGGGGRFQGLEESAGGRGGGRKIGGLTIQANRLGVILDVSGSMADDSERVNRIIAEQFENAICVQVEGCDLLVATEADMATEAELPFNFGQPAQTWSAPASAWPEPKPKKQKKEWPWADKTQAQSAQPAAAPVIVSQSSGTIQALSILANRGVDAVYWFCDLQDLQSNDALREVDKILRTGRIRLYLQSQEVEPGLLLREIIARSGGAYSVEF